ncbi:MAG: ABC transporter permease, partial [Gemmatimonadales bacterium]
TSRSLAWVDYEAARKAPSVQGAAAWITLSRSLGRGADAHPIAVTASTASLFQVLGVRPVLGRFYLRAEEQDPGEPVPCVAGHRFWRTELGGTAGALGQELLVGNVRCVIVGVAPAGFNGLEITSVDLWGPIGPFGKDYMGPDPDLWATDRSHWVRVAVRLAPGANDVRAADEATVAYRAVTPRRRDPDLTARVDWESIVPGQSRESSARVANLLFGGALVLLLLIAANLVNLFLVRDLERARETTVRLALGCPVRRLFLDRVAEVGLLAIGGTVVGLLTAGWIGPIARRTLLNRLNITAAPVDLRIVLAGVVLALSIGVVIAAATTLRLAHTDPASMLRTTGGAPGGGRRGRTMRFALVALQAALSTGLLISAAGFVLSFRRAATFDLGFDLTGLAVGRVSLDGLGYTQAEERRFWTEVRETVGALPGVAGASLGYMTPWWNNRNEHLSIPGRDTLPLVPHFGSPAFDAVTPEYLQTMGLRLLSGRWISDQDTRGSAPVLVINRSLADLYWPGEHPVGACLRVGADSLPCRTVVGIVADHRFSGQLEDAPIPAYFLPLSQSDAYSFTPRLFFRMSAAPRTIIPAVRRVLQTTRVNLPAADVAPMEALFEPLLAPWRLGSYAFTGLGALATMVGAMGLFSVLSYVVAERRREFAIRTALGATVDQIAGPVLWRGLATVGTGVALGIIMALVSGRWLQPILFQTRLTDPLVLAIGIVLSLGLAALASLIPARRAAGQDPLEVLRAQ